MNKSAGKYVIEGVKAGGGYLNRHFSKFFIMWVYAFTKLIGCLFIIPIPLFQKITNNIAKMISESGEVVYSKTLDNTDTKHSFGSLLIFDVITILMMVGGVGLCMGLAYLVQLIYCNIAVYIDFEIVDVAANDAYFVELVNNTMFLYIAFGILAAIFCLICLVVLQAGSHVASKNPYLSAGDIAYNALATIKEKGWSLFFIDFLYFVELLTFGGIIFVAIILIDYMVNNGQDNLSYLIIWICVPIFVIIGFFILPIIFVSAHVSCYRFFEDYGYSDKMVIAYRKVEDIEKDHPFVQLTPVEDENGEVNYINMEELKKQNEAKKKAASAANKTNEKKDKANV